MNKQVEVPTTVNAPNIAQMLLSESDYGTSDSKIKAAVDATAVFYFDEATTPNDDACTSPNAGDTCNNYDQVKDIFASQGTNRTVNVNFDNNLNSLQFLKIKSTTTTDTAATGGEDTYNKIVHDEDTDFTIPFSKLTGKPKDFQDSKSSADDYGRKGIRYSVLHNLPNGNAIALFATESKYLKDYDSDNEDAEMFAGGYWVEISKDTDGENNVVNAGVFSDADSLERDSLGNWALLTDENQPNRATVANELDALTATYTGKTEGGYSQKGAGAGGFTGNIKLIAKLFGTVYAPTVVGEATPIAGNVEGDITGIKLYEFQNFGSNATNVPGTVSLKKADVSLMGTMKGDVEIGTVSAGNWGGIFSNTPVTTTVNAPTFVLGTYGFEHTQGSVERAFLGHFGLEHPVVDTEE
ncbi:MAG: hypothetical protein OXC26_25065 [Albidovulum sp.]|nr:hypothetical protein [Albidovulum sp.]